MNNDRQKFIDVITQIHNLAFKISQLELFLRDKDDVLALNLRKIMAQVYGFLEHPIIENLALDHNATFNLKIEHSIPSVAKEYCTIEFNFLYKTQLEHILDAAYSISTITKIHHLISALWTPLKTINVPLKILAPILGDILCDVIYPILRKFPMLTTGVFIKEKFKIYSFSIIKHHNNGNFVIKSSIPYDKADAELKNITQNLDENRDCFFYLKLDMPEA